jgi:hypothetical protein
MSEGRQALRHSLNGPLMAQIDRSCPKLPRLRRPDSVGLFGRALSKVKQRLGARAPAVRFVQGDARSLRLDRPVELGHD